MNGLIRMADVMDDVKAYFNFMQDKEFLRLSSDLPLGERFRRIKHNYRVYQQLVDAGLSSWMETSQYEVGDWLNIFTPIEKSAWHDIRANGIPLWPQLPVGRFFVDFGNPAVKVAFECDGKEWHDERKDAARDRILEEMGWKVFRAAGWQCNRVMPYPEDFEEWGEHAKAEFRCRKHWETLDRTMEHIKQAFEVRA